MVRSVCGPLEAVTAVLLLIGPQQSVPVASKGLNHSATYLKWGQEKGLSARREGHITVEVTFSIESDILIKRMGKHL